MTGSEQRFHRTLKTSIMARGNKKWSEEIPILPIVLMGLRTAYKEDLGCSIAEMVYGETLKSDLVSDQVTDGSTELFVSQLKEHIRNHRPHLPRQIYIPHHLQYCSHVVVKVDKVRLGLSPPYEGPFKIIRRLRRMFVLNYNGRSERKPFQLTG